MVSGKIHASEKGARSGSVLGGALRVPVCVFMYVCWIYIACESPGLVCDEFVVAERSDD